MWVSGNASTGQFVNNTNVNRNCRRLCLVTCPPCYNLLHVLLKDQTAVRRRSSVPDVRTCGHPCGLSSTLRSWNYPACWRTQGEARVTDRFVQTSGKCLFTSELSAARSDGCVSFTSSSLIAGQCRGSLKNPRHVNQLVILFVERMS